MPECIADASTGRSVRDVLDLPADRERRYAGEVDRSHLMDEDESVLRLAGVPGRDGNLTRVLRGAGGDWADGRHPAAVKRLVRHHERSADPLLLVTLRGVEVDQGDGPAEDGRRHAGHPFPSSRASWINATSRRNSGSVAA